MQPYITGVSMLAGSSAMTFPKKYALTEYMLLLTSLKNTGRSSGKIRIMFWIELKAMVMVMKKRAPLRF